MRTSKKKSSKRSANQKRVLRFKKTSKPNVFPERNAEVIKLFKEARGTYGDTKLDVQLGLIFQMLHGLWTHFAVGRYADQNESEELKAFCQQFDAATNFYRKGKAS